MDIPWSRMSANRAHPSMSLVGSEFDETPGEQFTATFNPAKAEQLFAGSGHTFAEIAELGKDRKPLPRFPLTVSINATAKVEKKDIESANVVGVLPGSDPKLKDEYVVLSAHVDHLGIGEPINGDRIYNGAMDNAAGTSVLLDVAASMKKSPEKIRRSILFVFVTGEEKGLLGSKYFAAIPTVDSRCDGRRHQHRYVPADHSLETINGVWTGRVGPGRHGADRGRSARDRSVQPDPQPLRNVFIRSDQYNFIRHGILHWPWMSRPTPLHLNKNKFTKIG